MTHDADEILARMIADRDSDWPWRILRAMGRYGIRGRNVRPLSAGEKRSLIGLSHGLTATETAAVYGVGLETIKTQSYTARMKLRAKNTTHAVALAIRGGLIP